MNQDELWYWALNGSPVTSAMALAILDKQLGGKISKVAVSIDEQKSNLELSRNSPSPMKYSK